MALFAEADDALRIEPFWIAYRAPNAQNGCMCFLTWRTSRGAAITYVAALSVSCGGRVDSSVSGPHRAKAA